MCLKHSVPGVALALLLTDVHVPIRVTTLLSSGIQLHPSLDRCTGWGFLEFEGIFFSVLTLEFCIVLEVMPYVYLWQVFERWLGVASAPPWLHVLCQALSRGPNAAV